MERTRSPMVLGDRYVLEHELGASGPVVVWRAVDRVLDRTVAVKVLRPELAEDAETRQRFVACAGSAALLSAPTVVSVFDVGTGEKGGRAPFVVAELVPGETLREVLDRDAPLDPARAVELLLPILSALEAAHRAGIAHGSLRPDRVVVGADGRVRVDDFGTAAVLDPSAVDPREDIRAAGAILYETVTGTAPDGSEPLPPSAVRPGIPRGIEDAIARALDPGDTGFVTALAFASSLRRLRAEPPAAPEPIDWLQESVPPREPSAFRSWILVPLLLLVATSAVIGIGLALGRLGVGPLVDFGRPPLDRLEPLRILGAADFDPPEAGGDGTESPRLVANAIDGDEGTYWHTEDYFDGTLNKEGVGLLLDLGVPARVEAVRLVSAFPGFEYEIRVGDDPAALLDGEPSGPFTAAEAAPREAVGPAEGRYVLLWITSVVPVADANRAVVNEIEVLGPGG